MGKEHKTDNEQQQFWEMAIDTWQSIKVFLAPEDDW